MTTQESVIGIDTFYKSGWSLKQLRRDTTMDKQFLAEWLENVIDIEGQLE